MVNTFKLAERDVYQYGFKGSMPKKVNHEYTERWVIFHKELFSLQYSLGLHEQVNFLMNKRGVNSPDKIYLHHGNKTIYLC